MKQDRFEAMVARDYQMNRVYDCNEVWHTATVRLLRREHAAIMRAVRRLKVNQEWEPMQKVGFAIAVEHILALLAKRKGRKE